MLKHTLSFIILFFAAGNISAQITKVDSSEMVTLRIDPESARGAKVSEIFEEVKFIPLETTKESLFGSIDHLELTKNCFVIYDHDTKAVLIFNKNGKFKAKVNSSKLNESDEKDKQAFYGFKLIKTNETELIRIASGKKYYLFDLEGKLTKKYLREMKDSKENHFKFADSITSIAPFHVSRDGKDSTFHEIAILNNKKEVALYFPLEFDRFKTDQYIGSGNPITDSHLKNELFYIRYYDYNIYRIKPKSLSLAYRIIFPANNSVPKDFLTNPDYKNKRIEYFQKNPTQIYGISNPYLIGYNLYLKANTWGWNLDSKTALIHNLQTGALTSIKNLEADSLSQFLPVTDGGSFTDFYNHGFHLYEDEYLYTSYSSLAMFSFKDSSVTRNIKYDPLLSKYFETQNKKSNPVIIQLKPKKN
ncbi:6-bladed beta-propeller [Pedobacter sp. MC2016-05]|uniref:6-bladed beta-propeller n=1 Tax=Pedobacter sp. MC2016-05 TaxID=2994474 RepID=UPI002245CAB1|nr:6-bladed beta-propeller [Pedobacter sp. MC2016-05]MCX2474193.1 6-bladed beta-propeller [Pedobacter sp. MC2016-05]